MQLVALFNTVCENRDIRRSRTSRSLPSSFFSGTISSGASMFNRVSSICKYKRVICEKGYSQRRYDDLIWRLFPSLVAGASYRAMTELK